MTLYLSENEAENLQNGLVHIAQISDFEVEYLENLFPYVTIAPYNGKSSLLANCTRVGVLGGENMAKRKWWSWRACRKKLNF